MRRAFSLLAVPALLVLPMIPAPVAAADPGAPYTVTADQPAAVPKGSNWAFDDFFPRGLTVAQGATVQVLTEGFHTFTLLAAGTSVSQDMAHSGVAAADPEDTTRNPNGTTHIQYNLAALAPEGGSQGCGTPASPCSFDGTATISSGVPQGSGAPAPFDVKIDAAPGTYLFHCRIHAHMIGSLTVVAAGSKSAQTPAQVASAAAAQVKVDVAQGKAAEAAANHPVTSLRKNGTRVWWATVGTTSANRYVAILEMLPRKLTVKPGDEVAWIPRDINEPHTITFPTDIHTDMIALCEAQGGPDTPATPTVIPPTGPQDFACGKGPADEFEFGGGNGVRRLTSPATVADAGIVSVPAFPGLYGLPSTATINSWSVTVAPTAARGTYHYLCEIHQGMNGTIVVH